LISRKFTVSVYKTVNEPIQQHTAVRFQHGTYRNGQV